jgi:predicted PurR-regulated permease PerM
MPEEPESVGNPIRESVRVLGLYIKGQILITGIVTVLYAVGFAIAKVPFWPIVAIFGGLCHVIPKFGSLIALGLAIFASWIGGSDLSHMLMALAAWVVVQGIEGFVLTPRILGGPLGLRPLYVFLALLFGSLLFGPIGLLVAVPALAVGNVFWRYYRGKSGSEIRGLKKQK